MISSLPSRKTAAAREPILDQINGREKALIQIGTLHHYFENNSTQCQIVQLVYHLIGTMPTHTSALWQSLIPTAKINKEDTETSLCLDFLIPQLLEARHTREWLNKCGVKHWTGWENECYAHPKASKLLGFPEMQDQDLLCSNYLISLQWSLNFLNRKPVFSTIVGDREERS